MALLVRGKDRVRVNQVLTWIVRIQARDARVTPSDEWWNVKSILFGDDPDDPDIATAFARVKTRCQDLLNATVPP